MCRIYRFFRILSIARVDDPDGMPQQPPDLLQHIVADVFTRIRDGKFRLRETAFEVICQLIQ